MAKIYNWIHCNTDLNEVHICDEDEDKNNVCFRQLLEKLFLNSALW